jgi:hypothetical protein
MSSHKTQFQPGMSIPESLRHYGTEEQCAEALTRARWPKGFRCPRCDDARRRKKWSGGGMLRQGGFHSEAQHRSQWMEVEG